MDRRRGCFLVLSIVVTSSLRLLPLFRRSKTVMWIQNKRRKKMKQKEKREGEEWWRMEEEQ